jgi:hypothetical protein
MKINTKYITDLNIKAKSIKFLGDVFVKIFFIKMKNICMANTTIRKVKGQPTDWKKILSNHLSSKQLY